MHFAIGTTNKPKSEAIEHVLSTCPYTIGKATFSNHKAPSGVPDMPLTLKEIRDGAKNRAQELQKIDSSADFYVGMEGGIYKDLEGDEYWLIGVVYIENNLGVGNYGYSCHLQVPKNVVTGLFDGSNRDLEQIMHSLGGEENIGDKHGSYHAWTDGILDRKQQFVMAMQCAISPFFNYYYL